jgi:DNA gyrase subunit A
LSSGRDEVILVTIAGQAIRFKETELRPLGRVASGVRAMRLKNGDFIAGLDIIKKENNSDINKLELLVVTQNGFAKRTPLAQYKLQGRGGSGIKTAKISNKTGQIVAAQLIIDEEEILALSVKGQVIRTKIADIRRAGRATAGVKIMRLSDGDKIAGIVCL